MIQYGQYLSAAPCHCPQDWSQCLPVPGAGERCWPAPTPCWPHQGLCDFMVSIPLSLPPCRQSPWEGTEVFKAELSSQELHWLSSYSCACSQILYLSLYRCDSATDLCLLLSGMALGCKCLLFVTIFLCPLSPGFKIVQFLKALVTCFTFACVGT